MAKVKKSPTQRTDYGDHPKPYPFPSSQPSFHYEKDDYNSILGKLGVTEDSEFAQFLSSLGINGTGTFSLSQSEDWNKQLLDILLQYKSELEKRQYNEGLRDEQRLYDSPQAMLARLMGAGLSRDAALQLLGSGAGGSGSGVPYTDGISPDLGIAASQSALNGAQEQLANTQAGLGIANTVFGAIGTVSSLVNFGFSIPQAIQQTEFLKNSNLLNKSQLESYMSASKAYEILNGAGLSSDAIGSVSKVSDVISNLANNGNTDAISFINSGGLQSLKDNSYFSSQALHNLYRSERSSDDYDRSFGAYVDKTEAEADFIRADKNRVVQSILNLQEEFKQIQESTEFIRLQQGLVAYSKNVMSAQADLLRKQGKVADADALLKKAQELNVSSSTTALNLQNQYTQSLYEDNVNGKSGLQILTHRDAVNAYNDMKKFVAAKDKKLWDKEINYLVNDFERLNKLVLLQHAYTSGALEKYNTDDDFRDLMNTCGAFSESGAWNYLQLKYDAYKSGQIGLMLNGVESLFP